MKPVPDLRLVERNLEGLEARRSAGDEDNIPWWETQCPGEDAGNCSVGGSVRGSSGHRDVDATVRHQAFDGIARCARGNADGYSGHRNKHTGEALYFIAPPGRRVNRVHVRLASATAVQRGRIARVSNKAGTDQHLRDLAMLRRVRDRIDREYAQPLDVEALARGVNMSAGHLSRQFRMAYGESPYSYLMTRRIERAMALLRRGDMSVTSVCFEVGCSSLGTFSTRFTELVGMPPSAYRRDAAAGTAGIPACVARHVTRPVRNREARAQGRS